jgi:hypothetical protein
VTGVVTILVAMGETVDQLEAALAAELHTHALAPVLRSAHGVGCWPLACWPRSATTRPDSPLPTGSARSPALPPHPRLRPFPLCHSPQDSQTNALATPVLVGLRHPDSIGRGPWPTITGDAPPATTTTPRQP